MSQSSKPILPRQAARHEALYLRLSALTRQSEIVAGKYPDRAVQDSIRMLAEGMLFDCRQFAQKKSDHGLPVVGQLYGAMAAQLASALADLIGFEARHTRWDPEWKAQMWIVGGPKPLPVRRLAPKLAVQIEDGETAEIADIRRKLADRINRLTKGDPADYVSPRSDTVRPAPRHDPPPWEQ